MADAPWRCSECGTVNEPVANACRTCGRWPSLFDLEQSKVDLEQSKLDLEQSKVDQLEVEGQPEPEPVFEDFEDFEGEIVDEATADQGEPTEPAAQESPSVRRRRIIGRIIVPLAVVIYLVITTIVNR